MRWKSIQTPAWTLKRAAGRFITRQTRTKFSPEARKHINKEMALEIKPLKEGHAVTYRQPKNDILPRIPFRGLCLAPSGSGKTVTIVNMLTRPEFYGDSCFSHVYWCSPTATIDPALDALREYAKKNLPHQDQDGDDPIFHDSVDVEFLQSRINVT